jgi:hypothetical protein
LITVHKREQGSGKGDIALALGPDPCQGQREIRYMSKSMPSSLLLAEAAIMALVMYLCINLLVDIASCRLFPPTLFHLCWTSYVLFGIMRRSSLAWRVGYIASAISATLGIAVSAVFLMLWLWLFYRRIASFNSNYLLLSLLFALCSAYMYTIYYLLRYRASIEFFDCVLDHRDSTTDQKETQIPNNGG